MTKIEKEVKAIIAYTAQFKIRGNVFTPPGGRLSDFMSGVAQKKFIPVTDAVVSDISGSQILSTKFLELNMDEIIFIVPETEME